MGEVTADGPSRYPGPASFEVAVGTGGSVDPSGAPTAACSAVTSCEARCDPPSSQRQPFSVTSGLSSRCSGGSCLSWVRPFRAWRSSRLPRSRPGSELERRSSRSSLPARSRFSSEGVGIIVQTAIAGSLGLCGRHCLPSAVEPGHGCAHRHFTTGIPVALISLWERRCRRGFDASPSPRWRSCGGTLELG